MRVAIVHYHLSPGGVSTVIRAASDALAGTPHVILIGSHAENHPLARAVDGLGYLENPGNLNAAHLLENLRSVAANTLGGPPDLWHFHNHSLGKNILIPDVVHLLAELGERLVLQLHDLAEDGRPQNHAFIAGKPYLYPVSPRIRYAFINTRDRAHVIRAGLPETNAVLLPNPTPPANPQPLPGGPPLVLYPSRSIRRKNLGEFLLLAALSPPGTRFAITRAPEDPSAKAIHDRWKAFAEAHDLPVEFDVVGNLTPHPGTDASYEAWKSAATHFATTSVAEGSGLVFLESNASGKPLIGRNLSTNPFDNAGSLYPKILIPSVWIDTELLRSHLIAAVTETHRLYQHDLSPDFIESAFSSLHDGEHLDFGNLPEPLQESIILRVLHDPSSEPLIHQISARTWLNKTLGVGAPPPIQAPEVPRPTNPIHLYTDLLAEPSSPLSHLQPSVILKSYLTPSNFHFLLTSPPKIRAVIFDIYGTLLVSESGAIKPDPNFDPVLAAILKSFGHPPVTTGVLHEAVVRHHATSSHDHPEINLLHLWQELLSTDHDLTELILQIGDAWHPCQPMPHASQTLRKLSEQGIHLGLLSNAQINTLPALDQALGDVSPLFAKDLTIFSYQHLIAKPSPALFQLLRANLAALGIAPHETLFVGNDPLQDILPAATAGFRTALFTGHPSSHRHGHCTPDHLLTSLKDLFPIFNFPSCTADRFSKHPSPPPLPALSRTPPNPNPK